MSALKATRAVVTDEDGSQILLVLYSPDGIVSEIELPPGYAIMIAGQLIGAVGRHLRPAAVKERVHEGAPH
jgi:hypothetical protein